jgi:aminoglycoside 6'-N-acetyltransferase I
MRIASPESAADPSWLSLRRALWPDTSAQEHLREMTDVLARGHRVLLAFDNDGSAVGLVEASKRNDYVNGTAGSPVGFLEGLYVAPSHRRRGVCRALVSVASSWADAEGCAEIASDSLVMNVDVHTAHRALGFVETERVVYFCKRLGSG